MVDPWLSIIGLNEDSLDGLPPASRAALDAADVVFGGPRHLDLVLWIWQGPSKAAGDPHGKHVLLHEIEDHSAAVIGYDAGIKYLELDILPPRVNCLLPVACDQERGSAIQSPIPWEAHRHASEGKLGRAGHVWLE